MERGSNAGSGAGSAAEGAHAPERRAASDTDDGEVRRRILVLSGGGSEGAYEAGVLSRLRVTDYDAICGTSIGAINGMMLACGQGAALHTIWSTIAKNEVVRGKRPYRRLLNPSASCDVRVAEALRFLWDAVEGHSVGIADSAPVRAFLTEYLVSDGAMRTVELPIFWAAADLTRQCATFFYRFPEHREAATLRWAPLAGALARAGYRVAPGSRDPKIGIEQLRASGACPVLFDPANVEPYVDDTLVDGGVTDNSPFSLVRLAAVHGPVTVDVVLLEPVSPARLPARPKLAGILLAAFSTMRRRLLDDAVRALVREAALARSIRSSAPGVPLPGDVLAALNVTVQYVAPARPLSGNFWEFAQGPIDANFRLGADDFAANGWRSYATPADLCA